jgi:DNA-directed RNA polymerase specialized sigma24 family protein
VSVGTPFPEVLSAAQAGAPWALEVLYRDLAPAVTGYLRLHGALEPDDLASETFIGVFTGLPKFEGDESALRGWVFTVAHRRLIDDWRRRGRRPVLAEGGDEAVQDHVGGESRTLWRHWVPAPSTRCAPPCRPTNGPFSCCGSSPT